MPELETELRGLIHLSAPTTAPLSADELRRRAAVADDTDLADIPDAPATRNGRPVAPLATVDPRGVRRRAPFVLAAAAAVIAVAVLGVAVVRDRPIDGTPGGVTSGTAAPTPLPASTVAFLRANVELRHAIGQELLAAMRVSGSAGVRGRADFDARTRATDEAVTAWNAAKPDPAPTETLKQAMDQVEGRIGTLRTTRMSVTQAYSDGMNILEGYQSSLKEIGDAQTAVTRSIDGTLTIEEWSNQEAVNHLGEVVTAELEAAALVQLTADIGFFPTVLPKKNVPAMRLGTNGAGCGDDAANPVSEDCQVFKMLTDANAAVVAATERFTSDAYAEFKVLFRSREDVALVETVKRALALGVAGNDLSTLMPDDVHDLTTKHFDRSRQLELELLDRLS